MQQFHKFCLSIFAFSILSGSAVQVSAQSGGFPAFSPERETITSEEKSVDQAPKSGFPAFSDSDQTPIAKKNAFPTSSSDTKSTPSQASLTFKQLGQMLSQMRLKPSRVQTRYDFPYQATLEEQEIELYLTVLLAKDDSQIRIRAWLDPLPEGEVPADALLKMLSLNEKMNRGLHFAYSTQTKRFLLEKTISNQDITPEIFTAAFQDLSLQVSDNWETWATSQWKQQPKKIIQESVIPQEMISNEQFEMPVRR